MPPLYQFKVTLQGVEPTVWRRFVLPADGSFWDLGAALVDVMDYHYGTSYYAFYFDVGSKTMWPDYENDPDDDRTLMSTLMSQRFGCLCGLARFEFEYNLGYEPREGWMHIVEFEGEVTSESFDDLGEGSGWQGLSRCIAGERVCPPDQVEGYAVGYMALMVALRRIDEDASAGRITEEEREDAKFLAVDKAAGLVRYYSPEGFDPDAAFDPAAVEIFPTRGCDELREKDERLAREAEQKRKADASRIKRSAAAKASRAARDVKKVATQVEETCS